MTKDDLMKAMSAYSQSAGQTIAEHGQAVSDRYTSLYAVLAGLPDKHGFDWAIDESYIQTMRGLLGRAMTPEQAQDYHVYHDCGKPFCLVVDEQGRQHFPDHAEVSARVWLEAGGDALTAELIRLDMWCHTAKAEDRAMIAEHALGPTLLLTAWAEIHANAEMFGGTYSTSFKIKRKALYQLTKKFS